MAANENLEKVKKLFAEVFTGGHLEVCDEILSSEVQLHDPNRPDFHGGLQGFKEWEGMYQKAFPHKQLKIDDIFTAGEKVIVRWTAEGKHTGDLPGVPASGKDIKVLGISIMEFSEGKVSDMWNSWDSLGLYEQLGVCQRPQ